MIRVDKEARRHFLCKGDVRARTFERRAAARAVREGLDDFEALRFVCRCEYNYLCDDCFLRGCS